MKKLQDDYGLSRVIEPSGAVPVTAWKLDNRKEIKSNECRIALKAILLERDNFQQLCSEAGFDEAKIIAKVIDIIKRRGKLHNPFTNSAGQLFGQIEAMGENYAKNSPWKIGQEVLCQVTMAALPIHVEKVLEIDYNYGLLQVTGYAIIFEATRLTTIDRSLSLNYTIAAFDEGGTPFSIYNLAEKNQRFLIIGKDLISSIIYISTIKKALGNDCYITVVLDDEAIGTLSPAQVTQELADWTDSAYIVDVTQPIAVSEKILKTEKKSYDFSINCEDLTGAETIGVQLTRDKGQLYFTSLQNNYAKAMLIAESMDKELTMYSMDIYVKDYEEFIIELLYSIKDRLDRINELYKSQAIAYGHARKKALSISESNPNKADDFIFSSAITEALVDEALNVASYDCNLIIQGETGVGKEKILSLIHKNSSRRGKPCVRINCATIQENLAESEFFGYEAGSFTGAQSTGKKGYFEAANNGILFLDEVGTLSMNLQSKLLRVLQENQFIKVGGTSPINVNVRVICANNIPLRQLVEEGKFREDLYYRLNIYTLTVPPLRERREDISELAKVFLANYCKTYGADKEFDSSALIKLADYDWPGNVRELENLVHRSVISVKSHIITGEDISELLNQSIYEDLVVSLKSNMYSSSALDFNEIVAKQEVQLIQYALKKCNSTRKAAEFLNMTQSQLMRKKEKYGL